MTVTPEMVARLRALVAEPSSTTYTYDDLERCIARYPVADLNGYEPYNGVTGYNPPVPRINPAWVATYDLNRAAADVWDEKAGALAELFNFATSGQRFDEEQKYKHAVERAAHFRSKRRRGSIELITAPDSRIRRDEQVP